MHTFKCIYGQFWQAYLDGEISAETLQKLTSEQMEFNYEKREG